MVYLSHLHNIKIILEIPSYPDEFFVLRDCIMFITSVSVMRIFVCVVLAEEASCSNCKALLTVIYLLFKFSTACIKSY
jgi:hypothetical protein